jgi:hypothetical protein
MPAVLCDQGPPTCRGSVASVWTGFLFAAILGLGDDATAADGNKMEACDHSGAAFRDCISRIVKVWPESSLEDLQSRFGEPFRPLNEKQHSSAQYHVSSTRAVRMRVTFQDYKNNGKSTLYSINIWPKVKDVEHPLCLTRTNAFEMLGKPRWVIAEKPYIHGSARHSSAANDRPANQAWQNAHSMQYVVSNDRGGNTGVVFNFPDSECAMSITIQISVLQ